MSNQGEPLLKPVHPVPSSTQNGPVYLQQSVPTHHERDVAGEGCFHFSNNFYLTAAFGAVFAIICVFQTFGFLVFGYILPTCLCSDFWVHLLALSTNVKLIYFTVVLFMTAFTVMGVICLRGLVVESKRKIVPFLVILVVTELAIVIGGGVGAIKGSQALEEAMANQTKEDMFEMLALIFKEKFVKFIETAIELQEVVLNDDALDLHALANAVFNPEVLVQADAVQQMMIFTSAMIGLGINVLIVGAIFLLVKVIQRMNKFEQYMVEAKSVPYMSPQYLTPLENPNGEYQYMPTGQVYNQMPPYNSSLTKRSQRSRQSEENLLRHSDDYFPSGVVQ